MDQLGYAEYVQGEVGLSRARPALPEDADARQLLSEHRAASTALLRTDEFMSKSNWVELGGSQLAADYLATVDEEGLGSVAPCDVDETRSLHESLHQVKSWGYPVSTRSGTAPSSPGRDESSADLRKAFQSPIPGPRA
eukprot:Skav200804  [mRNA]  locus=scaffold5143:143:1441:- [translate_table: standard]